MDSSCMRCVMCDVEICCGHNRPKPVLNGRRKLIRKLCTKKPSFTTVAVTERERVCVLIDGQYFIISFAQFSCDTSSTHPTQFLCDYKKKRATAVAALTKSPNSTERTQQTDLSLDSFSHRPNYIRRTVPSQPALILGKKIKQDIGGHKYQQYINLLYVARRQSRCVHARSFSGRERRLVAIHYTIIQAQSSIRISPANVFYTHFDVTIWQYMQSYWGACTYVCTYKKCT